MSNVEAQAVSAAESRAPAVDEPKVDEPKVDEKEVLRQSIERSEADLREAVEELTAAVKSEVTLGGQIAERPAPWLLGGLVVGLLLSWRR